MLQLFCVIAENFRKQKHAVWCLLMDARFALLSKRHNNVTCKAGLSQRQKKDGRAPVMVPNLIFRNFCTLAPCIKRLFPALQAETWEWQKTSLLSSFYKHGTTQPYQCNGTGLDIKKTIPPTCWILLTHLDMNSRQNMLKWMWHDVAFLDMLVYCSIFNTVL